MKKVQKNPKKNGKKRKSGKRKSNKLYSNFKQSPLFVSQPLYLAYVHIVCSDSKAKVRASLGRQRIFVSILMVTKMEKCMWCGAEIPEDITHNVIFKDDGTYSHCEEA